MDFSFSKGVIRITGVSDFEPSRIFECGQCFRWNAQPDGSYIGVAGKKAARVRKEGGSVYLSGTPEDFNGFWREYFDLDREYAAIRDKFSGDGYLKQAAEFGAGIRILRQDRWEVLCSFIISQCNNIPRIKGIIERLCALYGEPLEFEGKTYYTFPEYDIIAGLEAKQLEPLSCGYRAPYIIGAARALRDGTLNFKELESEKTEEALKTLKKLDGVGDKVANCVLLFGLNKLDAFPVDVWMKRALAGNYPESFDPAAFGGYAGIAQQYIFYYARSKGMLGKTMITCECDSDGGGLQGK